MCTKAKGFQKHFFIRMFYNYLLLIGRINSLCNDIYFTVTNTPSPPLSENYVIIYVRHKQFISRQKQFISLCPFNMSEVPVADVEETVEKAYNDDEENDW